VRPRADAQGYTEMMDNRFKPRGAPRRSSSHRVAERLGKNAALATGLSTAESANRDPHLNSATVRRQIQEPPLVAAMQAV